MLIGAKEVRKDMNVRFDRESPFRRVVAVKVTPEEVTIEYETGSASVVEPLTTVQTKEMF